MILVSEFFLRYQSHFSYHVLKLGSVKPQDGPPVLKHDEYLVMAIKQCLKPENIQSLVEERDSPFMDSDVPQVDLQG